MPSTIHLHGAARARFGGPFRLDVTDAAEAVRALCRQLPGFRAFLRAGDWRVRRGEVDLDLESLRLPIGRARVLHLIPMAAGAGKGKGIGKIVAGVALVAASFIPGLNVTVAGVLFSSGLSVGLAGVSSLIAPTPRVQSYKDRERAPGSALFNNTVQMTEPGSPLPLALGREVRAGSIVPSIGLTAEVF